MVIEYIGDLIRNETANRRETEYENQVNVMWERFHVESDSILLYLSVYKMSESDESTSTDYF